MTALIMGGLSIDGTGKSKNCGSVWSQKTLDSFLSVKSILGTCNSINTHTEVDEDTEQQHGTSKNTFGA